MKAKFWKLAVAAALWVVSPICAGDVDSELTREVAAGQSGGMQEFERKIAADNNAHELRINLTHANGQKINHAEANYPDKEKELFKWDNESVSLTNGNATINGRILHAIYKSDGYVNKVNGTVEFDSTENSGTGITSEVVNTFDFNAKLNEFVPEVEIIEVPDYLYANAKAAVPVRFEIKNMGEKVTIGRATVSFFADGKEIISNEEMQIAMNDGYGRAGNGECDKYTGWIKIDKFQGCEIEGNTTENAYFKIKLTDVSSDRKDISTCKEMQSKNKIVKVFGDKNVNVVEIDNSADFNIFDKLNMLKTFKKADDETIHLGPSHYKNGPHLSCNPTVFGFDKWIHERETDNRKVFGLTTYLEDKAHAFPEGLNEEFVVSMTSEEFGIYFGISYGSKNVEILEGRGMDLNNDSCNLSIVMFSDAKLQLNVDCPIENKKTECLLKNLEPIAFEIIGSLAKGGWGSITGVGIGLFNMIEAMREPANGEVEATCYTIIRRHPAIGEIFSEFRYGPKKSINNFQNNNYNLSMNTSGKYGKVGDTWSFLVNLSSVTKGKKIYPSPWALFGMGEDYKVGSTIKYSGDFTAPIKVLAES